MSTAPSPRLFTSALADRSVYHVAALSAGNVPVAAPDLTIHRITETHHGRTLLLLGHAAEYLATSRFLSGNTMSAAEEEAIHILMTLSRRVFDEHAEEASGRRRLDRLVLGCVTRLLN